MANNNIDPVANAQNLINTFNSYKNPTIENLHTMTTGINSLLTSQGITSDQTEIILSILTSQLLSNQFTNSPSFEYVSEELSQMSVSMNNQFLATIIKSFSILSNFPNSAYIDILGLIAQKQNSTTTLSSNDYIALWSSINTILVNENIPISVIQTLQKEWDATLNLYFNLNYSNYITKILSQDVISSWIANLIATLTSTYKLIQPLPIISTEILVIFTDNGLTSTSGMSTAQFISACNDTLAFLSSYLDSSSIQEIRISIGTYISDNFFNSTTYANTMGLSAANTLTSSVSFNFTLANLPFTPYLASSYQSAVLSSITSGYTFTSSQSSSIQTVITNFFNTNNLCSNGMTPKNAYALWTNIQAEITTWANPTTLNQQLLAVKATFLNTLQTYILENISQILSYKVFIHNNAQEFLFTNPFTGAQTYAGNYLSDWATNFLTQVSPFLTTTQNALLNDCLYSMMNSNNNGSYGVNGATFIQIGCELLLWLSNFISQNNIDTIATDLKNFLLTFGPVYRYISNVDEALEIIAIVIGIIAIIIASLFLFIFTFGGITTVGVISITALINLMISIIATGVCLTAAGSATLANTISQLSQETSFSYAIATTAVTGFLTLSGFFTSPNPPIDLTSDLPKQI